MALRNPFDKRKHRKFKKHPKPGVFPTVVGPLSTIAVKVLQDLLERKVIAFSDILEIYKLEDDLVRVALVPTTPRHIFGADTNSILPDEASDIFSPLIAEEYQRVASNSTANR